MLRVSEEKAKPKIQAEREEMPRQDPQVRRHNFNEVALGFGEEQAVREAQRCLSCKKQPCVSGCPVEIDIPSFVSLVSERRFGEAIRKIRERNALPAICGRVCPQEDQCEKQCVLGKKWEPVAIGRLERFVADYEMKTGEMSVPDPPPQTGKKVAIVGSGPAGLTVAGDLVRLGHAVTIFEALHKPGGVLVYGIPEFRLPKDIVRREVEYIERLGANLVCNFVVGKTRTIKELMEEEGFDAVFVATGAGLPYFMNIPGENLNGVYSANEFLTRSNLMKAYEFPKYDTPIKVGRRVAVVGGGNVAMDSARTAMRLGADDVYCIYRRSRKEMPAREEEIENALEEEMILKELTNPVKIHGDGKGWVKEIECIQMQLGEPDASGRRRPVPVEGSEFRIPVDVVVMAIGQGPNPLVPSTTPGLKTTKWGNIIAEETSGATSLRGVFAGGDIVTGAATVILAMGAGRVAARAIDAYLTES
jgi:glutamate synthase (NADPH/NADH) small chain